MSSTECAWSAQSSAKRTSLISTWEVLVFELSRRRLNTFPSVRNRMSAPKSLSWNASLSMAENTSVNNSGAITQPCLVPFVTENGSDVCPWSYTRATIPSWNDRMMSTNRSGQPIFRSICHKPSLLIVSKAFVRSTNTMYRTRFCSLNFSCTWRAANIMSIVLRCARKPHWLSGKTLSARCRESRFTDAFVTFPFVDVDNGCVL